MTGFPAHGTPLGELARAALVALSFGALFVAAELWRRRGAPPVEWTRKLVHMGGGIVCGAFPWLFESHWSVLGLAALSAGTLTMGRRARLLPSVTDVDRHSRGELWFPAAVYLLFVVARHQPIYYAISLAVLVFSDAAAALIGRAYGRLAYAVGEDRKSIEGSAVFFVVTFLAVHLALLLGTSMDRGASVLVAAQIALLVASFEAISMRGNDNIVVPLGTYYLLLKMTPHAAAEIGAQLLAQLGLLLLCGLIAWRARFLTTSGAVAAHLVLYAAFSLGGPTWTLAPLGALAGFLALDARHSGVRGLPHGGHQVHALYHVSIVSVLLLFADNSLATLLPISPALRSGHPLFPLFVGALAAPLAIVTLEMGEAVPVARNRAAVTRAMRAVGGSALAVLLPGLAVLGSRFTIEAAAVAVLVTGAGLALHLLLRGRLVPGKEGGGRLASASVATLLAVVLVLPLHFLWTGVNPWSVTP